MLHKNMIFYLNIFTFYNFINSHIFIKFSNYFIGFLFYLIFIDNIVNYIVGINIIRLTFLYIFD